MLIEYPLSMAEALIDCNKDEDRMNDLKRLERLRVSYSRHSRKFGKLTVPANSTESSRL